MSDFWKLHEEHEVLKGEYAKLQTELEAARQPKVPEPSPAPVVTEKPTEKPVKRTKAKKR